jgi:hypothetical protein
MPRSSRSPCWWRNCHPTRASGCTSTLRQLKMPSRLAAPPSRLPAQRRAQRDARPAAPGVVQPGAPAVASPEAPGVSPPGVSRWSATERTARNRSRRRRTGRVGRRQGNGRGVQPAACSQWAVCGEEPRGSTNLPPRAPRYRHQRQARQPPQQYGSGGARTAGPSENQPMISYSSGCITFRRVLFRAPPTGKTRPIAGVGAEGPSTAPRGVSERRRRAHRLAQTVSGTVICDEQPDQP